MRTRAKDVEEWAEKMGMEGQNKGKSHRKRGMRRGTVDPHLALVQLGRKIRSG